MKNSVKEERLRHEMTQSELAERVGVSRQTIFSIEINKYVPSVILSIKLARVFGKKVEDVFKVETGD